MKIDFTDQGYLHVSAAVAATHFPNDGLVALVKGREMWLMPTRGAAGGGLLLKQRNRAGDRSVLIWETLMQANIELAQVVGAREAFWDGERGALRVALV